MQRIQLRAAHADVAGAFRDREDVKAGVLQERFEAGAEIVIEDRPKFAVQLVLRRVRIIDGMRWVAERHVGEVPAEHPLDVGQHRGVAAQQPMVAQNPEIARLADRVLQRFRNLVLNLIARRLAVGQHQQPFQLRGVEPNQVEVEALVPQPHQLFRQQRVIPAGLQGDLVIGQDVGPLLRLAKVLESDYRHLGERELAGRQQSAVSREDAALLVDEHRVRPAELHRARRDLIHLRVRMRARVALVWVQRRKESNKMQQAACFVIGIIFQSARAR